MKHTIQALVENKFGVLARVSSLFSARGYNIASLAVGETQDPAISCMTVVVDAEDERILEQINKQLHKLIDVITVIDFTRKDYIDRELVLVKVYKDDRSPQAVDKLMEEGSVCIVEENQECYILQVCSDRHKIDEILKEIKKLRIKEMVRSGRIAVGK